MTRTITLETVDHGPVEVAEPGWCTGHAGWPVEYRADITHNGPPVYAEVETSRGAVRLLEACISWAPFAELSPEPHPVVAVVGLAELPSMSGAELRGVAAELGLFVGRLYRLSNEVDRLRRAES